MGRFDVLGLAAGVLLCGFVAMSRHDHCELHGDRLVPDEVPVLYGRGAGDGIPYDVSARQFPKAHLHVLGGCIVGPDSPRQASVQACNRCRRARRAWVLEYDWPERPFPRKPWDQ